MGRRVDCGVGDVFHYWFWAWAVVSLLSKNFLICMDRLVIIEGRSNHVQTRYCMELIELHQSPLAKVV